MGEVKLWPANKLPLPKVCGSLALEPSAEIIMENIYVPEDDLFPKGKIIKFFEQQGYGFIVDRKGREIYFCINELNFVGPKNKDSIKIGSPVGYDISRTSNGLHVRQMKIY